MKKRKMLKKTRVITMDDQNKGKYHKEPMRGQSRCMGMGWKMDQLQNTVSQNK